VVRHKIQSLLDWRLLTLVGILVRAPELVATLALFLATLGHVLHV
jgi:hypothetical protein